MKAEEILKIHNLKNTGCRKCIIVALQDTNTALSENDIKTLMPDLFDRVTFYRSMKTLEDADIIHRIVLHDASVKYALNHTLIEKDNHPHFHCTKCDDVVCLESQVSVLQNIPSGFSIETSQILLEGICPTCKKQ